MTEVYIAKAPLKKKTRWIKGELNPVDQVSKKDRIALEYLLKTVFENQHSTSNVE